MLLDLSRMRHHRPPISRHSPRWDNPADKARMHHVRLLYGPNVR